MAKVIRILVYEGDRDSILQGLIRRNVVNTTEHDEHGPPNHNISEYFVESSDGVEFLQKSHEVKHFNRLNTQCQPLESDRILNYYRTCTLLMK